MLSQDSKTVDKLFLMLWGDTCNSPIKGWHYCLRSLAICRMTVCLLFAPRSHSLEQAHSSGSSFFFSKKLWAIMTSFCDGFYFFPPEFSVLGLFISHTYCWSVNLEKGAVQAECSQIWPQWGSKCRTQGLSFHRVFRAAWNFASSFEVWWRLKHILKFHWSKKDWQKSWQSMKRSRTKGEIQMVNKYANKC